MYSRLWDECAGTVYKVHRIEIIQKKSITSLLYSVVSPKSLHPSIAFCWLYYNTEFLLRKIFNNFTLKAFAHQMLIIYFKFVSSRCKLSYQRQNFAERYCGFHFFGPRFSEVLLPTCAHLTNQSACC